MAKVTIVDVAKKAGVSLSTASDILNGKLKGKPDTARRVKDAARVLGYHADALARRLRTRRSEAFGLVAPYRRPLFSSALLTDLLSGIQGAQVEAGLNLVLASRPYDQPGEIYGADLYQSRTVDGLIVVGTRESYGRDHNEDVRALRELDCPLVWLHVYEGTEPVNRVTRGGTGSDALFEHLRARGYTGVGVLLQSVGRHPGEGIDPAPHQKAAARHGLTTRPEWLAMGEIYDGSSTQAAMEILRLPAERRPRALLCHGDDLAVAALQVALGLGLRVPGDVAIASNGNYSTSATAAVPITTLGVPMKDVGARAVARLVELIADPAQPPQTIEIPGGLVVRAST